MSKLWPDYTGKIIVHFGDEATRQTAERTRRAAEAIPETARWAHGIAFVGPYHERVPAWGFEAGAELARMAKDAGLEVWLGTRAIEDWGSLTTRDTYRDATHWARVHQHARDIALANGCMSCVDYERYGEAEGPAFLGAPELSRGDFRAISQAIEHSDVYPELGFPCDSRLRFSPAWLGAVGGNLCATEITYLNRRYEWMTDLTTVSPYRMSLQPDFVGVHLGPVDLPITDPENPPLWGPQEFWSTFPRTECLTRYTEGIFVNINMADFYRTSTTMAGLVAEGGVA